MLKDLAKYGRGEIILFILFQSSPRMYDWTERQPMRKLKQMAVRLRRRGRPGNLAHQSGIFLQIRKKNRPISLQNICFLVLEVVWPHL